MTETLEIVNFRLKPGTEAGFVASNGLVSDWLARQPGFVSRCLARRDDGAWVDVVRWHSREQPLAAAAVIAAPSSQGGIAAADMHQEAAPVALGAHVAVPAHAPAAVIEAPVPPPADGVTAPLPVAPAAPAPLSEAVIVARLRQCFERANAGGSGEAVAVSVVSTLHISLHADGSVRSAIFNPPLKPEFMACAGGAIAGKFAEGNRQIDLPVSFHAR